MVPFESLVGFFVACNSLLQSQISELQAVSIPGGFFRGLQHGRSREEDPRSTVSIPGGFFRGLQRGRPRPGAASAPSPFQSLVGFFVACNSVS